MEKKFFFAIFLCITNWLPAAEPPNAAPWGKVRYELSSEPMDVIIPCAPKDLDTLELCIEGLKKYAINIRRIIVISKENFTESAEWFPETLFPFSQEDLAEEIFQGNQMAAQSYIRSPHTRIGWIFQQLLKFYAPFVIPEISPNVLIIDSDLILLQPMSFMTEQGGPLFTPAVENTREYFEHAKKVLPGFYRVHPAKSGIAHHMLFQKPILEDLFALIEREHNVEAWRAICRCINRMTVYKSPLSEYEIYFNFVLLRCNQGFVRPLRWANIGAFLGADHYRRHRLIYVASHRWMRDLERQLGRPLLDIMTR